MSPSSFQLARFVPAALAAASARAKRDKRGLLNLSSNELVHRGADTLVQEALGTLVAADAVRYPYWPAFEEELAARLGLPVEQLMLTAGSDEAYKMLLAALEHPGRVLVSQAPNYEQLALYAKMQGLALRTVPYRRDEGFCLDDFDRALACPPCTVWISNPNGPSGWLMPHPEVVALANRCAAHGHLLVIDEAYADFAGCSHLPLLREAEHVVVLRSLSKGWALAGARLAWLASSPALARSLRPWNTENPVSGLTLALAHALLRREPELVRIRVELKEARDWFAAAVVRRIPDVRALRTWANFVHLELGSVERAAAVAAGLRARGVLVRAMEAETGLGGCIRVTAAEHEIMESLLEALCEVQQQHEGR